MLVFLVHQLAVYFELLTSSSIDTRTGLGHFHLNFSITLLHVAILGTFYHIYQGFPPQLENVSCFPGCSYGSGCVCYYWSISRLDPLALIYTETSNSSFIFNSFFPVQVTILGFGQCQVSITWPSEKPHALPSLHTSFKDL